MSITEKPKNIPLPWDTGLLRTQINLRHYSHSTFAKLITVRAGRSFSRSYVTKVLNGIRRPSVPFVRAMSHELGLPLPPEGELMGAGEYILYRLDVIGNHITELKALVAKGE